MFHGTSEKPPPFPIDTAKMSTKTFLVGCALYGVPGFILGLLMAGLLMGDSSAPEGVSYS
jgi:hypothetical protein